MLKYDVARRYRIYCDTDAKWVEGYSATVPTACFDNPAHSVSTTKNPQLLVDSVELLQHDTTAMGVTVANATKVTTLRLRDDSLAADDFRLHKKRTSSMVWVSPAHPCTLYGIHTNSDISQADDCLNLYSGPQGKNSLLGVLATAAAPHDTVIHIANPPANSVAAVYTGFNIGLCLAAGAAVAQVCTVNTTGAYATLTQGEYFTIYGGGHLRRAYYVWMDTAGDETMGDPLPLGFAPIAVDVSAAASDVDVAAAIQAALDGEVAFSASRSGNIVTVTNAEGGQAPAINNSGPTIQNVAVATTTPGANPVIDWIGEVADVNTALMKLRLDSELRKVYPAWTTRVYTNRQIVKGLFPGTGGQHTFGELQLGSMSMVPNTPCTIEYTNNHMGDCFMYVDLEYGEGCQNLGTITS